MFAAVVLALLSLAAPPKPHIVWKPIPFGAHRKAEMAAYSKRHYGIDSWRLHPKVIVEHYTGGESFSAAWHAFASNQPDPELGELPGTCAHFIVDRDGKIHQLVSLRYMCRHTVGLNYTAIGIEHVGMSDAQVLGDAKEMRASLRLTRWLQAKFGITTNNVIGHAESLSSPYHRERVKRLRRQTHGDWTHADMQVYRAKL
jgi:beta-N-acetylhexosaminidase